MIDLTVLNDFPDDKFSQQIRNHAENCNVAACPICANIETFLNGLAKIKADLDEIIYSDEEK